MVPTVHITYRRDLPLSSYVAYYSTVAYLLPVTYPYPDTPAAVYYLKTASHIRKTSSLSYLAHSTAGSDPVISPTNAIALVS